MSEDLIAAKLDTLIRLQATSMVDRFDTQKERISFLSKAGLAPKDIGSILGVSANSVSVALSSMRKKEG
ncbi:hypothetical protein [Sphingopyxis sp.]|jgi:DNA-binding NarL/FixJ family response regulator|uniref:hypothetical protein n=1 Tax=Sphingopyxis sp. TaxID=1908224 RepID=UPI00311E4E95